MHLVDFKMFFAVLKIFAENVDRRHLERLYNIFGL